MYQSFFITGSISIKFWSVPKSWWDERWISRPCLASHRLVMWSTHLKKNCGVLSICCLWSVNDGLGLCPWVLPKTAVANRRWGINPKLSMVEGKWNGKDRMVYPIQLLWCVGVLVLNCWYLVSFGWFSYNIFKTNLILIICDHMRPGFDFHFGSVMHLQMKMLNDRKIFKWRLSFAQISN